MAQSHPCKSIATNLWEINSYGINVIYLSIRDERCWANIARIDHKCLATEKSLQLCYHPTSSERVDR